MVIPPTWAEPQRPRDHRSTVNFTARITRHALWKTDLPCRLRQCPGTMAHAGTSSTGAQATTARALMARHSAGYLLQSSPPTALARGAAVAARASGASSTSPRQGPESLLHACEPTQARRKAEGSGHSLDGYMHDFKICDISRMHNVKICLISRIFTSVVLAMGSGRISRTRSEMLGK